MNPDHLELFVRLASTLNISRAGEALELSPAVASAHLARLEQQLGVRLVHRSTRQVSLTQDGLAFLPHAENILAAIESAKASVGAGEARITGTLRITAPASFGRQHLVPALTGFAARFPELRFDLRLSDTIVDLVEGGFDVAIRNARLEDSSLIAKRLANDRRVLCASPRYLEEHGIPEAPEDLARHQCIQLVGLGDWCFDTSHGCEKISVSALLQTDNGEAVRDACIAGLGIAIASTWNVYRQLASGELITLLDDYPLISNTAIWAVYPSSRLVAPKVRAFIDTLADYYGDPPYWDR